MTLGILLDSDTLAASQSISIYSFCGYNKRFTCVSPIIAAAVELCI